MVLRFPDLPDALQHYFVTQLSNETTAGRLAQASQACNDRAEPQEQPARTCEQLATWLSRIVPGWAE